MVCTFGDLTDVTWWRELGLPVRSVLGPDGRLREVPWGERRAGSREDLERRARELRRARRAARSTRRADGSSSCCEQSGDLVGEPQPVTRAVKFFEKGERPVEIVTSRQWFIRTIEHRERADRARARAALASAVHARALRGLGERPDRRLVRQPPALLRRAVPGLVSARRRRERCCYDQPIAAREEQLPVDPSTDVPDGYERRRSAGSPAASSATPT